MNAARLILGRFTELGYMALNVGEGELLLGTGLLQSAATKDFHIISSNIFHAKKKGHVFTSHVIIEKAGYKFLITGAFPTNYSPRLKEIIGKDLLNIKDPKKEIGEILLKEKGKYDFSIVLSSMMMRDNILLANSTPGIDLIIGAKEFSRNIGKPNTNGTLIFSNMPKGANISILKLQIRNAKDPFVDSSRKEQIISFIEGLKRQKTNLEKSPMPNDRKKEVFRIYDVRISQFQDELTDLEKNSKSKKANSAMWSPIRLDAAVSDDAKTRKAINDFYGKNKKSI